MVELRPWVEYAHAPPRHSMTTTATHAREAAQHARAFGLVLRSCLPLPAPPAAAGATPDVCIDYGPVAPELPRIASRAGRHQVAPGDWLLSIDEVARYRVSHGRQVTIDRHPHASDTDVRLFLLGSTLGAVFHQRDDLVLHGSAVATDEGAAAFLGDSGSGKSTTAAAFHRRGRLALTDDLCVVRPGASGSLEVQPGLPSFKLWEDALAQLDVPSAALPRVGAGLDKRALAVEAGFAGEARPLTRLYLLQPADVDGIILTPLDGVDKFTALVAHTYRLCYVDGLGVAAGHFRHVVALARQARVVLVQRPRASCRLDALIDALTADFTAPIAGRARRSA
jgi:hypothetical protein